MWYTNIYRSVPAGGNEEFLWSVSRYQPAAGFYDSDHVPSLNTHLDQMKAAGVDFLIVDGTNGYVFTMAYDTDVLLHTQLTRPASQRIPISFALGAHLWAEPPGSATAVPHHQAEVDKAFHDYVSNATTTFTYAPQLTVPEGTDTIASLYHQHDGHPLLVVYNSYTPKGNGTNWLDPRFSVRHATGIISPSDPNTAAFGQLGWWGWVTEYPQLITTEAIGVTPGADNKHRGCSGCLYSLDRQNGLYFEREWLRAIQANPGAIVVSGWNDYIDETAIEPASPIPGSMAPAYLDAYGVETPDLYLQIATAYGNLRTGLMPDAVYAEENASQRYRVVGGKLVAQSEAPHQQPTILLPAGTLAPLLAP